MLAVALPGSGHVHPLCGWCPSVSRVYLVLLGGILGGRVQDGNQGKCLVGHRGLDPIPIAWQPIALSSDCARCAAEDCRKLGVGLCGPSLHTEGYLARSSLALG